MTGKPKTYKPSKPTTAGRYKLSVYFIDHQDPNDRPKTFWSHKKFDERGIGLLRLRKLVTSRWKGKVAWAAIYDCAQSRFGPQLYKFEGDQWHSL